jgi:hypothetical protein
MNQPVEADGEYIYTQVTAVFNGWADGKGVVMQVISAKLKSSENKEDIIQ